MFKIQRSGILTIRSNASYHVTCSFYARDSVNVSEDVFEIRIFYCTLAYHRHMDVLPYAIAYEFALVNFVQMIVDSIYTWWEEEQNKN